MIRGILFALFFILLGVGAGLAIFFGYKHSKSHIDVNEKAREIRGSWNLTEEQKKVKLEALKNYKPKNGFFGAMIASIATAVVTLGLVICIPGSFHQVEAGTYAVVKRVGKIIDVRSPGTYFDFYMTKKYEIYDTTVQQVKINTSAYSHDAQSMDLEVYLQYQIQLDKLVVRDEKGEIIQTEGIAGKYVTLESLQARIETQTIEKTKAVMSAPHFYDESDPKYNTDEDFAMRGEEIIRHRAAVSEKVSSVVKDALIKADFYVNVTDVVLTNIDFTDAFEKSVEDKVIAEQNQIAENTKAETAKQVAIKEAEAQLAVAQKEAEKKIVEANAEAEAQKIIAQASAEAATYKIVELAKVVGYDVNPKYNYKTTTTIYTYKDDELTQLEKTETNIVMNSEDEEHPELVKTEISYPEGTKTKVEVSTSLYSKEYSINLKTGPGVGSTDVAKTFNQLVEEYLQYLAYLEQWNGELPQVIAGNEALSIIVPNN